MRDQHYLVCYDISSDKGRRRIEKILSHFGYRVQFSVFECHVTKKGHQEMVERLQKTFKLKFFESFKDSIMIYPLCETCVKNRKTIGKVVLDNPRFLVL